MAAMVPLWYRSESTVAASATSQTSGSAGGGQGHAQKTPRRIVLDLGEQRLDAGRRPDIDVGQPAVVTVTGVERPGAVMLVIAELGDLHARPVGPDELAPWRPALDDRDAAAAYLVLETEL